MADEASLSSIQAISEVARDHAPTIMFLMEAVASKAAKEAADQSLRDTWYLMGIDLKDPEHIRSTRDAFQHMIDSARLRRQRAETFHRGIVTGFFTLLLGGIVSAVGYLFHFHFPSFPTDP